VKLMVCGCIMAGGQSSRMGTNKALLDFHGQRLIERTAGQFTAWFDQVVIVTNTPGIFAYLGLPMVEDRVPGLGPLGGIEAGLSVSRHPYSFFAACDMPFLNQALIAYLVSLAGQADIVVPRIDGEYQPMHAVYSSACLPAVQSQLASGIYKVTRFFEQMQVCAVTEAEVRRFGDPKRLFFNCNTPAELDQALGWSAEE